MICQNKRLIIVTTIISFLCAFRPALGFSQGNATLVIWLSDGKTTDVDLYIKPQITFSEDKLLITSPVINLEYSAEDVLRFTFKGKDTKIDSPTLSQTITQENDKLIFGNLSTNDKISIYDAKGILVPIIITKTANGFEIPLASIPTGVYILKVNNKTVKFTRK